MDSFNFQQLLFKFRFPLLILLSGLILLGFGVFIFKSGIFAPQTKIEVLDNTTEGQGSGDLTVEVSGAVESPGVYKMPGGSRVEDLLIKAGGFSASADRDWVNKYLNRAAKLIDGQKIFIPSFDSTQDSHSRVLSAKTTGGDQTTSSNFLSDSSNLININTASLSQLDSLPGIGQTYGQNIIEHRPYSNTEELLSKGILRKSVYEKIKNLITVY